MESRITYVTLGVSDLRRSEKFYADLGFQRSPKSSGDIVFFITSGPILALFPRGALAADAQVSDVGSGFCGFTLAYNVRSEKEVDQLFSELAGKGVKIVKGPEHVVWGGYSGYFSDPDGFLWEVAFNPFLELDERGNPKH
jgi:catechol 2,3-dioxygenase-like lactoylglutathione lyase family enzyme